MFKNGLFNVDIMLCNEIREGGDNKNENNTKPFLPFENKPSSNQTNHIKNEEKNDLIFHCPFPQTMSILIPAHDTGMKG